MNPPTPQPAPPPFFRNPSCLAGTLIVLVALAAYGNSFHGPFLYDDLSSVANNPTIRHVASALSPPAGTTASGRPLLNLSFAVNYATSGPAVWSYHAVNLAIHILAGLMLFGIVRRTLVRIGEETHAVLLGLVIALLWTVHPLQTESVTYIVQRAESLMGLLYLLTLYCFVRGVEGDRPGPGEAEGLRSPSPSGAWLPLSFGFCLLGMAAKEVMVTAPLIVLLYDRTFVAGSWREAWRRRRYFHLSLAATWLFLAYLVAGNADRGGTAGFGSAVSWWEYALTQFRAIVHYLRLAVWPHPLVADYGRAVGGPPVEIAVDAAIVVLLVIGTLRALLRPVGRGFGGRALGFSGAWFFLILAPSSSVAPVATEIIAEHRMYLPLAAVIAVGVCGTFAWFNRASGSANGGLVRLWLMLSLVLAAGLACLTARRNLVYRSDLALWSDTAARVPENPAARNNLGNALLERGSPPEAIAQYRQSLRLAPYYPQTYVNLGIALDELGRSWEATAQFEQALRLKPSYPEAHYGIGNALLHAGRTSEAVAHFEAALQFRPDYAEARTGLGTALAKTGRLTEAVGEFQRVVQLMPGDPDANTNLANAYIQMGRLPEAIAQYERVVRLAPDRAEAHNNLGILLAESDRRPEARAQFEEALRLRPDYAEARENLARLRALESGDRP